MFEMAVVEQAKGVGRWFDPEAFCFNDETNLAQVASCFKSETKNFEKNL